MPTKEALHTRVGDILDLVACSAISQGADPKSTREWTFDEVMKLR